MKFQKRHYESVAEVMLLTRPRPQVRHGTIQTIQWVNTVEAFCQKFQADNARFKPSRFKIACGGY